MYCHWCRTAMTNGRFRQTGTVAPGMHLWRPIWDRVRPGAAFRHACTGHPNVGTALAWQPFARRRPSWLHKNCIGRWRQDVGLRTPTSRSVGTLHIRPRHRETQDVVRISSSYRFGSAARRRFSVMAIQQWMGLRSEPAFPDFLLVVVTVMLVMDDCETLDPMLRRVGSPL
jgi:hypothetical protein